ncbi:putative Glycosyltransferase [Nitrospira japonica]|uniref:Putative Glycosyltransferase n=1 Tax=Nitrospira japonica TaxID=1325564 RepID=A0A1W1IAY1_9BACT|nr:glycosyltransferase family 2 protein [Nitrospira japonica]SLM50207.1 putative Glycosyltransferase [Nitrospira japonica]
MEPSTVTISAHKPQDSAPYLKSCEPALVSVVIPAYNCGNYIAETLESVIQQDYPKLEVLVVDDGSTDHTKEVVASVKSDRVRYVYQQNSGGPSGPRNTGVQQARGKYVAFLDSDDIMLPGKIQRAVDLLDREPHLGLVFANFVKFDESTGQHAGAFLDTYEYFKSAPKRLVGESQYVIQAAAAYDALIVENYIGTSGVVAPKAVLADVGPFDLRLRGPEDYDLWLRIAYAYDIGFIDMIGHRYRVRPDGITGLGDAKLVPHSIQVMQKQLDRPLPSSTRRNVRKKLAMQFFALGYCHQMAEEMKAARQHYLLSLKEANYWLSWKGLFMTFLGGGAIRRLKQLRGD